MWITSYWMPIVLQGQLTTFCLTGKREIACASTFSEHYNVKGHITKEMLTSQKNTLKVVESLLNSWCYICNIGFYWVFGKWNLCCEVCLPTWCKTKVWLTVSGSAANYSGDALLLKAGKAMSGWDESWQKDSEPHTFGHKTCTGRLELRLFRVCKPIK